MASGAAKESVCAGWLNYPHLFRVVEGRVNHAIPDRLRHNVLRVLLVLQLELLADVLNRDPRVRLRAQTNRRENEATDT